MSPAPARRPRRLTSRPSRYRPLAQMQAISKQDYTDAAAQARQAHAPASPRTKRRCAPRGSTCTTPASRPRSAGGSAGRWSTVGALVTANQADPLAVIQRTDPIYVDIQQSSRRPARRSSARIATGGVMAGQHASAPQARGRQRLRLHRRRPSFRDNCQRKHRDGDPARANSPIRRASCCRACSSRRIFTQAVDPNVLPRTPAGGAAGHWRRGLRVRRRRRQQGRAPRRRCSPHVRRRLGRHRRPRGPATR